MNTPFSNGPISVDDEKVYTINELKLKSTKNDRNSVEEIPFVDFFFFDCIAITRIRSINISNVNRFFSSTNSDTTRHNWNTFQSIKKSKNAISIDGRV